MESSRSVRAARKAAKQRPQVRVGTLAQQRAKVNAGMCQQEGNPTDQKWIEEHAQILIAYVRANGIDEAWFGEFRTRWDITNVAGYWRGVAELVEMGYLPEGGRW